MLWHDNLISRIEEVVDASLKIADDIVQEFNQEINIEGEESAGDLRECHRVLQQCCPACYGGSTTGTTLADGCDSHVSVDGNFNHWHLRVKGQGLRMPEPELYLSQEYVDEVGEHIEAARKKNPRERNPKVPDSAVDECEDGHIAGSGTYVKTSTKKYDDTSTMALVCRHNIPIFLANINTPGEQQKYAVALIGKLYSLLPSNATVAVFYDVGCVLDRSLELYQILPAQLTRRLLFATSAMHTYAHQWACQLVYNPRLREALGLSNGEVD
ncbi:hypothetical protein EST38_g14073 [Candolleomyces aberdarensis]|uniref:Uncharacterized protein n=1 Tax=Candolleomyces aberdarensis TaxID=2316362 RepID=A0A4Q2CZC4_9AGAR|nr:hypothetical protein EST38_g14073 [Candolleomyces aberdarensis]